MSRYELPQSMIELCPIIEHMSIEDVARRGNVKWVTRCEGGSSKDTPTSSPTGPPSVVVYTTYAILRCGCVVVCIDRY